MLAFIVFLLCIHRMVTTTIMYVAQLVGLTHCYIYNSIVKPSI